MKRSPPWSSRWYATWQTFNRHSWLTDCSIGGGEHRGMAAPAARIVDFDAIGDLMRRALALVRLAGNAAHPDVFSVMSGAHRELHDGGCARVRDDRTLFQRSDEVEAAWRVMVEILAGYTDARVPGRHPGRQEVDGLGRGCEGGWSRR